ncbi:dTDP-4-dehydrorhamnose reductase [Paenibacillus sp. HB172176]|uniref:dTDP-4-dehydrorhamnose reductase n=1 Tax=Paenibacillus sp. HB172176 TaxID=2493690 RepID=UPI0014394DCC|nr:dTDP-4-dehydrorhamnose reductase [Paenibacillus sp. HB172176]
MTYKVAITGAGGMLGRELSQLSVPNLLFIPLERAVLDVTNAEQCRAVFEELRPHAVIHCAAYTAVDQAESHAESAFLLNEQGTKHVAEAAARVEAKLIYISTDYVFDGSSHEPYVPQSPTNPITVYGKSKLAGEHAVQAALSRYFIVRTSWVYGRFGKNFVETMLQLAQERERLTVVADQIGSPTYTYDLARFLARLVLSEQYGVYHAAGEGCCSWFEFAKAIFEIEGAAVSLSPCTTEEFPRPATRPPYSVLDCSKLEDRGFARLRHWREALYDYLTRDRREDR